MYGDRQYWEERYQDGVVGYCQQKGVVSNEWCVSSGAFELNRVSGFHRLHTVALF